MADEWSPGDLAECIDVSGLWIGRRPFRRRALGGKYLRKGMVYIVQAVEAFEDELRLDVGAAYGAKLARRFRKVPPVAPEAEIMRAATPQRERQPA